MVANFTYLYIYEYLCVCERPTNHPTKLNWSSALNLIMIDNI